MGLFKKKSDPISERAKTLNEQIAALQVEIERLSETPSETTAPAPRADETPPPISTQSHSFESSGPAVSTHPQPQPRLRSTAFPQKHHASAQNAQTVAPPTPNPFSPPVFEEIGPSVTEETAPSQPPDQSTELGIRKDDFASLWKRWTNHLRGPATSNPKLVNYLAAGSIQGLRPLRYERRVARNRLIVLVVLLIAVLWGLIAVWMKRS